MNRVQALLSLGWACRTRYQIDRFMERQDPGFQPTSHFFDYLMMGGMAGVVNLVERDFAMTEADLVVAVDNGGYVPADVRSHMIFFHDFGARGRHWDTPGQCREAMADAMADSLGKYRHLGQKTIALLADCPSLGLVYQPANRELRNPAALLNRYRQLRALLARKFGRNHLLVNVVEEGRGPILAEEGVLTLTVNDAASPKRHTPREWEGSDESWGAALARL